MRKPLILVTNDDGIAAPGLKMLVEIASELGEVVVVAPDAPQSGQGHAITITQPLRLHRVGIYGDVEAYECSGTPVDCVKLARHVVLQGRKPDLCVSGINHGSNASINIIYSGTMSAAMEASLEGVNSIGFSLLNYSWEADFRPCAPLVRYLMQYVLDNGLTNCSLLNVNFPNLPEGEIKGLRVCRQADARWVEEFMEASDPRGEKYYWLTGRFHCDDTAPDTDIFALQNGYAAVVPTGHDLTRHEAIAPLRPLDLAFEMAPFGKN